MLFKKISTLIYIIFTMLIILVFTTKLSAQMQNPENFDVFGQSYYIDSVLYADFYMSWVYPDSVDGFNVYVSYSQTDDYNNFELLKTFNIKYDSISQNYEGNWFAYLQNIDIKNQNVLSFYITAFKGGIASGTSNISYCHLKNETEWHSISFTTTPSNTGKINVDYIYQFDVQTDLEKPVFHFELNNVADSSYLAQGAYLDTINKTVTFTPTEGGQYYFNLYAKAQDDKGHIVEVSQFWGVNITECDNPSSISGTIKNEDGEDIKMCYVALYMLVNDSLYSDSTGWNNLSYIQQTSFQDGKYAFTGLDKGTYYIQVYGIDYSNQQVSYYPQWFYNAIDIEHATPIQLDCADSYTADFVLVKIPVPIYYKVSGYVKDASNNQAIENAQVDFIGQDSVYGNYVIYSAFTNGNGYYEADLLEGGIYTASASAGYYTIDSSITNQYLYMPIYWDGKTDPSEADKIQLTGDLNNINFNLRKIKTYENSINGYVNNENGGVLQNVLIIAYIIDGSEDVNNMYRGYLAMSDKSGYFEIKNLYPAEYVLLAVPAMNVIYAPGFYKENDFTTLTWEDATKVTVGETGAFGSYNVKLQLFEKVLGVGIVKGIVRAETGRVKSVAELQGNDGLQGVQVHVVDLSGNRIKSTETDKSGSYQFTGLANGTYKIVLDKIGYKSDNFNVTIDNDNILIDRSVTLVPAGSTKVEDDIFLLNSISVYPNPASDIFTVNFNGNGKTVKLVLFDAQGNIVYSNSISTDLGENNINVGSSNLSSGTYFIRIEMNSSGILTPVIIAK